MFPEPSERIIKETQEKIKYNWELKSVQEMVENDKPYVHKKT